MVAQLVRLKLTLLVNTFRRSVWQTVGLVVASLYALGLVTTIVVAAVATGAYDPAAAGLVLTLGGALAVLGWWLIPVFLFGVDATLDPHRFVTFAIPRRTLLTGLALAACISVPGIATVLAALGSSLAWWRAPAVLPIALLSAALGVATCVVGSRAVTTALAPLLESRRYREVLAIVALAAVVLVGPAISSVMQALGVAEKEVDGSSVTVTVGGGEGLVRAAEQLAGIVAWTPFGAAWSLPATLYDGDRAAFAGRLAVALASLALLWLVWDRALARSLVTPAGGGRGSEARGLGWFGRFPATPLGAVAARCTTYWLRDPRYSGSLAIVPLLPIVLYVSGGASGVPIVLIVGPVVAWVLGFAVSNDVAYDYTAFALHVSTSTDGRTDRWGRALPVLLFGVPLVVLLVALSVVLTGRPDMLPALLGLSLGTLPLSLGVASAISSRFLYPVPKPGESPLKQPQGAAVATMVAQLLALLITAGLSVPAVGLTIWSVATGNIALGWAVLLVGPAVGIATLLVGIRIGARTYDRRAPELLQQVLSFP
ncbi:hypothetical protein L1785_15295 [Antribacter sp. KLBMP9083]|uniref:Transporter n=1 Tax=Antribacter soli TaxID=2910976 RepID=A0AA41QF84_9MICO|nr:hypothetical protein [Antribacter soli]MCF4122343.1 hypothetical protein [Antribacter soli]